MNMGVIGVYENEEKVIEVIKTYLMEGFDQENFSVLAADSNKTDRIEKETNVHDTHVGSEEAFGIISGFLTGISGGFIIPGMTVPGIGPLLAAGPLASMIEGNRHNDLHDLLAACGIKYEQAEDYVQQLNEGKIILFYEGKERG